MSSALLLQLIILLLLVVGTIYSIRLWKKKLNQPTDRRKEIEKSLKVDKIESLYEKGEITPEEFQKIRQVIARKLNSTDEETSSQTKTDKTSSHNNTGKDKKG